MNSWKLQVQSLGKLKAVELTVTPFMIFVGENNSGKSYLMEFLWGLLAKAHELLDAESSEAFFQQQMEPQIYPVNVRTLLRREELEKINAYVNATLNAKKQALVTDIFNHDLPVGALELTFDLQQALEIQYMKESVVQKLGDAFEGNSVYRVQVLQAGEPILSLKINSAREQLETMPASWAAIIYTQIALYLIRKDFYESKSIFSSSLDLVEPIYFPASRTGFMHTYRAIIGNQRKNNALLDFDDEFESKQIAGTSLTLPTVLFLEKLQKLDKAKELSKENQATIHFFEQYILHGRIRKNEYDQVEFMPDGENKALPLHVTSSLIAELSPMYLFLNSTNQSKLWIIEEIESHLNPKIQIEVMRLLVRLYNDNQKAIWITTHSDSVVQRLNNLLTLSQTRNAQVIQQLGYTESDLFNELHEVKAYELEQEEGYSTVRQLQLTDYGFEMNVFNDVITKLIQETYLVQEASDEDV